MSAAEPIVVEDFFKPATWENPYPAYRKWRERSPLIARIPFVLPDGSELEAYSWLLLKHDGVYGALRDHETFSSDFPPELRAPAGRTGTRPEGLLSLLDDLAALGAAVFRTGDVGIRYSPARFDPRPLYDSSQ